MKMKVVDQLHLSALGPATMAKGAEFEVSDPLGKDLEQKGLATRVEPAKTATDSAAKSEPAPANKKEPAPVNKTGAQTQPAK